MKKKVSNPSGNGKAMAATLWLAIVLAIMYFAFGDSPAGLLALEVAMAMGVAFIVLIVGTLCEPNPCQQP
ncbi:MAG TPA: hypothetical protein VF829_01995 [Candidatus Paceibacterota bacterium]